MTSIKRLGAIRLPVLIGLLGIFAIVASIGLALNLQTKVAPSKKIPAPVNITSTNTTFIGPTSTGVIALAPVKSSSTIKTVTPKNPSSSIATVSVPPIIHPSTSTGNVTVVTQPTVIIATTTVANPTTTPAENNPLPPLIAIDPQTIMGILCYYNVTLTNRQNGVSVPADGQWEVRGSGVIYDNRGDILTNRHVIQQPESLTTVTDANGNAIPIVVDYQLDRCEVGQLPAGTHLPTASEIESINPYVQVPVLGYTAQPFYISPTNGLSNAEIQNADFAFLKITGISKSGPTFGVTAVPNSFPYAKLLAIKPYQLTDESVITYGFPGNVTAGQGNAFETLTMTGSVGHVTEIDFGDQYYAGTPLVIQTDMEVAHGRSGSPLFWRGYVIGIVFEFVGDSVLDSASVASDAILQAVQN